MNANLRLSKLKLNELFVTNPNGLALLCLYQSPVNESSIARGIPATPDLLDLMTKINKVVPIFIKYRGPRRKGVRGQATCLKKDATSFAVYLR